MNNSNSDSKFTVSCPSGHRLRGDLEMIGETVSCPKCQTPFVFAPTRPEQSVNRSVTDTGVMRILGEMPQPPSPPMPAKSNRRDITDTGVMRILGDMPLPPPPQMPAESENRAVTDTGVMRILGEVSESPSPRKQSTEHVTRPCSRCGVAIQESLAVCPHCDCYLGVKPSFLQQMSDGPKTSN